MYTKEQVEEIIKRIIHVDSFGDVHRQANIVAKEMNMNISVGDKEYQKIKQSLIEDYGYSEEEISDIKTQQFLELETKAEFLFKYGFEYNE